MLLSRWDQCRLPACLPACQRSYELQYAQHAAIN